jgi:hypothetical protein
MNAFLKQPVMRFKAPLLLVMGLIVFSLRAQVPEYNRHISRSFRVTNAMTVEVSNKYGRVQIIPWNVDSVKFNIDMRIRAKDNQKLEKMKQNVEFEFTPGQYFLVARTKFGDSGSDVFKDIVDIAGTYLSASNSVSINYTIMVPTHIPLKIENKFGDVFFDDHDGTLNLTLSYGDLKANRLNGRTEIKLTSGDGEINYLKDGQLFISYTNMHIRETAKLLAQTRSSVVTIDKFGTLKLDSRRDKMFLNEAGTLSGESYFSNINLVTLHNSLSFNSRYGNITLDGIQQSFSLIDITSEFTDLTLSFEKPMIFNFELTHSQDITFVYPKTYAKLTTKVFNAEDKLFTTSGTVGTGTPESMVVIKALRKCNLTFSQK